MYRMRPAKPAGTCSFTGRNLLSLRLAGPEATDKQHLPTYTLLSTNATGELPPAAGTPQQPLPPP
jgi:hypothetical protein